jgi:TorA maturation chaperone TorD
MRSLTRTASNPRFYAMLAGLARVVVTTVQIERSISVDGIAAGK